MNLRPLIERKRQELRSTVERTLDLSPRQIFLRFRLPRSHLGVSNTTKVDCLLRLRDGFAHTAYTMEMRNREGARVVEME